MSFSEKLQSAIKLHQSGNLQQAEHIYREILAIQPDNPYALHLLGVIFYQFGNYALSIEHIKKSLYLHPNNPDAYNHLGSALKATGDLDEAIRCFRKAIAIKPGFADAYYNLANTFIVKGQPDEAIVCYRKAIELNPNFAAAYNNLGNILNKKGEMDEATLYYQKALQLNPHLADAYLNLATISQKKNQLDSALTYYQKASIINPNSYDVFNNIGVIFQQKGQLDAAITYYQMAVQLNPTFSEAYNNLGNVFQEKGQHNDAIVYYKKAIQLNPNFATAYNNLGNALQEKGQIDEAVSSFEKALHIKPDFASAYKNLGNALHDKGQFDEAIASYQKALTLNPDDEEIYSSMGSVLQEKGQFDEAMAYHQKALQIKPDLADAHWNMSLTLLLYGNFKEGWGKYEWRLLKKDARPSVFLLPLWDGRLLHGRNIIVSAEQGVGDEIMFASCLPEVIAQVGLCIIECDKRLMSLFSRSFPKIMAIGRLNPGDPYPSDLPPAEMKIPIGSIPKFLRPNLASFPQQNAYLIPDDWKVESWRKRFSQLGSGLKIGISWRGGSKPAVKHLRSTILEQWKSLFSIPGVHFINLQYGDCTQELEEAKEKLGITIHEWEDADPLKDLDTFAAQISALDLVISVDNATVHIAGALGVPVWALLPFACDWRWMREFEDTPWYKTVRLIRQGSPGNWDDVFERVASDLRQYLATSIMPDITHSYKTSLTAGATVHQHISPVLSLSSDKTYRCAVITPVGPGHEHLYRECLASIKKSFAEKSGIFSEIIPIRIDDLDGRLGRSRARNLGIKKAAEYNIEWIFFLDADDVMAPSTFEYVSFYLDGYDGVWGSIWTIEKGETTARERPKQLPFLYSLEDVLSCDPFVTLQMGHFVKTQVALATLFDESLDIGEDFDYYLRVWENYRCIKIPLPFFYNRRGLHSQGPRSATGYEWRQQAEEIVNKYRHSRAIRDGISTQLPRKIISLLCPTRGRPDLALRFIRSVIETAGFPERIETLFYIDLDDERIEKYREIFNTIKYSKLSRLLRCEAIWGEPISVSKSWNILAENCKGDILALSNDDQIYIDKAWDIVIDEEIKQFPDEIYCIWFNDGINGPNLCAFPIVSRKWYETLGYFTPEMFEYFYVDTWIMDIAKRVGRLYYIPHILVEHRHFTQAKSTFDDTYKRNRPIGRISRDSILFEKTVQQRQAEALKLLTIIDEFKKR